MSRLAGLAALAEDAVASVRNSCVEAAMQLAHLVSEFRYRPLHRQREPPP